MSSCADKPRPRVGTLPPDADLAPEPEPQLDPNAILADSAAALDAYDTLHNSWGRREHGKLTRICWYFRDLGLPTPDCGPRSAE